MVALLAPMVVGIVVVLLAVWVNTTLEPARRGRVHQFVRRTGVTLTHANAPYVVDALARTRRWRFASVLVATAMCLAWDVITGALSITVLAGVVIAAGVLVGTTVGELRNAVARGDAPRTALLAPRERRHYVGAWSAAWPAAASGTAAVLAAALAVRRPDQIVGAPMFGALAVGAWALSRAASRFVLDRPRPSDPDVGIVAADEGLRSRALHAIAGSASLVATWSVIALAAFLALGDENEQTNTPLAWLVLLALVASAVVAVRVAVMPFMVRTVDASAAVEGASAA